MRILFVSSTFLPTADGPTRVIYDQARKLVEAGHEVHLITRRYAGTPKFEVVKGIKVTRVKPIVFPMARTFIQWKLALLSLGPGESFEVIRKFKQWGFDVMHAHGILPAIACIIAKIIFKVPLVITLHGSLHGTTNEPKLSRFAFLHERLLFSSIHKFIDSIIVPSYFVKKALLSSYGSRIAGVIKVIPNTVDLGFFNPKPKTQQGTKYVLFVGTLMFRKGVDVLIKAAPRVLERVPNAKFLIVGTPLIRPSLIKLAMDLGVADAVEITGHVSYEDLLEYYSIANVFAFPSFLESFGIALIEAMAMGVPVVSTRCSAIPEIVDNGSTGILVEKGNSKELAAAITRLLQNSDLAHEMAIRGREVVKCKYSLDQVVQRLSSLYLDLKKEQL